MPTISELIKKIKNGEKIYLFDVRSMWEFKDFHIDGSVNLPFDEIADIENIIRDRDALIYVFCQTGRFSKSAKSVLKYMGYKNVYDLGGFDLTR